jgi:hypothetical protein
MRVFVKKFIFDFNVTGKRDLGQAAECRAASDPDEE